MKSKQWIVWLSGLLIAACGGTSANQGPADRPDFVGTLKFGHIYAPDFPWGVAAQQAADEISMKTNGAITIQVLPNQIAGNEATLLTNVQSGNIDIVTNGAGQIGNIFKPIMITEMPYLFRDLDHLTLFLNSPVAAQMQEDFRQQLNVKVLGAGSYGLRHLTADKAVHSPADLAGFKLREPVQQVAVAYGTAFGATVVQMSLSASPPTQPLSVYDALKNKTIDGEENPLPTIDSKQFYNVQSHLVLTGHVVNATYFLMNDTLFQQLSNSQQKIVTDAFKNAGQSATNLIKAKELGLIASFQSKGMTVVTPDMVAFKASTAQLPAQFSSWWASPYGADLFDRIQQMK